ncbi:hypothetical protein LPB86_14535 [Pedobacter sp. MC2016-14]|uniref:NUMOD1 domain-containing DNA-binding protein n=1 Tax=Pedobacter sp. MC2016-14 TaxID=2897327 RepID=UPI001E35E98C|nr:NUMOD1 domain-containing DNA-binding protein [Pedobacter sp. MC2016-14]MCD0489457.1 hypothetical protein [Pedobacter sp. MC2016-14]
MIERKKLIATISRYNLSGDLLETYPNARIAAEAMNSSQQFITYAAQGKKALTACGYIWRRGAEPSIDLTPLLKERWHPSSPLAGKQHTVGQYDLEGNLLNTYTNTKTAGKAVGFHYQGIRKVIRGEGLTYGGFIWSKEIKKKIKVNPRIKSDTTISQYDLDGRWIKSFKNAYLAGIETGVDDSSITHAINGKVLTAGKYIWRNGQALRLNVNELRRHPHYAGSALQRHMKKKRELVTSLV